MPRPRVGLSGKLLSEVAVERASVDTSNRGAFGHLFFARSLTCDLLLGPCTFQRGRTHRVTFRTRPSSQLMPGNNRVRYHDNQVTKNKYEKRLENDETT